MSFRFNNLYRFLGLGREPSSRRAASRPTALRPHTLRLETLEHRQLLNAMPVGAETRVHPDPQATTFPQLTFSQSPKAVAMEDDGSSIVAYNSVGEDASQGGVFVRRYSASGVPIGNPILANTTTLGNQTHPGVAEDADGDFVVVWDGPGGQVTPDPSDDDGDGIYLRRFNGSGAPKDAAEIRANTTVTGPQVNPTAAMDADGDFVVVWTGNGNQPGQVDNTGVFFQRFDRFGNRQGNETRVNVTTADVQELASVGMDPNGNFVVVWGARNHPGDFFQFGVYGRAYDANGNPTGGEFQVNSDFGDLTPPFRHITGNQFAPDVDLDDNGNFVVTYTDDTFDVGRDVWARLFNANANPIGPEFRVNTTTAGDQEWSRVAVGPTGNFVITWNGNGGAAATADNLGVFAQRFQADGTPAGGEFLINTTRNGNQQFSGVATDIDGDFVVVWSGNGEQPGNLDTQGVFRQLFTSGAPTITLPGGTVGFPVPSIGPVVMEPGATITDPDAVNFNTGTLTVTIIQNAAPEDQLSIRNEGIGGGQIGVSGNQITFGGVLIGTFAGGNAATPLVVTFNAAATQSAVQAVMRNVTYEHSAPMLGLPARTVQFVVVDDCGSASNPATTNVVFGGVPPGGGGGRTGTGPCPTCLFRRVNFIADTYLAVLDRPASNADVVFWDNLMARGVSKEAFAAALVNSAEYRTTLISGFYTRFLRRFVDPAGLAFWLARMNAGVSQPEVAAGIVGSPEYLAANGGTNAGFVTGLYADLLGRGAGPAEVAFYVAQLNSGVSRGEVALGFLGSVEFRVPLITNWYFDFLGFFPGGRRVDNRIMELNFRGRWDDAQVAILTGFDAIQVPLEPFRVIS